MRHTNGRMLANHRDSPTHNSGLSLAFKDVIRTKVTSGRQLLPGIDGRSYWVRRVRDIMERHISDLGGLDNCSEAEKSIVRRASVITIECERLERRFALVKQENNVSMRELDMYSKLANSLRRLLDMAGLERRSRDITPTIDQYVAAHADDPDNTDEIDDDIIDVIDPMHPVVAE